MSTYSLETWGNTHGCAGGFRIYDARGTICQDHSFTSEEAARLVGSKLLQKLEGSVFWEDCGIYSRNQKTEYPILIAYPIVSQSRRFIVADLSSGTVVGPPNPSIHEFAPDLGRKVYLDRKTLNEKGRIDAIWSNGIFWVRPPMILQLYSEECTEMHNRLYSLIGESLW